MGEHGASRGLVARTSPRWETWAAVLVALGIVVAVLFAAFTAIPPVLRNLSTSVADGTSVTALPGLPEGAGLLAPAGWLLQEDGDAVLVSSPDRSLLVSFRAASGDPEEALVALLEEAEATPITPTRSETLTGGLRLVHLDADDGAVCGVVASGDRRVAFVARVAGDADARDYRAALAGLLDGIRG